MNYIMGLLVGVFLSAAFCMSPKSYAADIVAESLCSAIVADDRQRFRALLGTHNLRVRQIFISVRCNNLSMLQFAITAEAIDVGELLIRHLPSKALESERFQGKSITEWAIHSGYGSSPVLGIIRERLGS